MFTLDGFIFEEIMSVEAESLSTGRILYRLPQVSDCTIDVSSDSVDATDKDGDIIKRTYKAKTASVTMTNAHLDMNAYAAMAGTKKYVAANDGVITATKTLRVDSSESSYTLPDTPITGTIAVASLRNTGSVEKAYDLDSDLSEDTFTYSSSSKKVTFPTPKRVAGKTLYFFDDEATVSSSTLRIALSSSDAYVTDEKLYLAETTASLSDLDEIGEWLIKYEYETNAAVQVNQYAKKFPKTVKLIINALGYDTCEPDVLQLFRIVFPRFQPSPESSLSMTTDATFDFTGEARFTYCGQERLLYTVTAAESDVYESDDDTTTLSATPSSTEEPGIIIPTDTDGDDDGAIEPDSGLVDDTGGVIKPSSVDDSGEILDSWEDILERINNGVADYELHQYKTLDLGDEGTIEVEIVGEDTDNLADETGTAKYTFMAKNLLKTRRPMNPKLEEESPANEDSTDDGSDNNDETPVDGEATVLSESDTTAYVEGTGGIGGWEKSEMRAYLKESILPLFPEELQNGIKTVSKTQTARNTAGNSVTQNSEEDIFIPTRIELRKTYADAFADDESKIRTAVDTGEAEWYWLRNAGGNSNFYGINEDGASANAESSLERGVCICFCI